MAHPDTSLFRAIIATTALAVLLGCSGALFGRDAGSAQSQTTAAFGPPPATPDGPLSSDVAAAVEIAFIESVTRSTWDLPQEDALTTIAASGDPRLAWIISDLMRFVASDGLHNRLSAAASDLLGTPFTGANNWGAVTDHLIA